jgi:uncharacterized membrane protein YdjX (TVP38/TMEM64 family)
MRLLWIALALAILFLLPFVFWGEEFTRWFSGDAALEWIRGWGAWGWAAVMVLLCADLFLPLPGTGVMSAAGLVYGAWIGGAISAAGSFLSGMLAYGLSRLFGQALARKLAGEGELERNEEVFRRRGAWLVVLSRGLPLLPEVVACLAGLSRMPLGRFAVALLCGCVPMGFAYAAIGAAGQERPALALTLSIMVPALLWAAAQAWMLRGKR